MSTSSNALLRHRVIDGCLRDLHHKYTLKDLIDACTAAMKEKYGNRLDSKYKVSLRSIQLDLQVMRSSKGYGAPIVVYDHKYYKYSNPNYTIEKAKLGKESYNEISGLVEHLGYYASFEELGSLRTLTRALEEEIDSRLNRRNNVISYEVKGNPIGLEYFNPVYDAIIHKKALCIGYFSSRSNNIMSIIFYPFYLKSYKGRWYALGYKDGLDGVYKLPLDRIRDFSYSILPFPAEYSFNPHDYFKDIIGVTRLSGEVKQIKMLVKNRLAPFLKMNPMHNSQKLEYVHENGDIEISINIIPNREFYNLVMEYQPYVQILQPREIGVQANARVLEIAGQLPDYTVSPQKDIQQDTLFPNDELNLFSNL